MLYLTMLENFETTSDKAGEEHMEGMIRVRSVAPPNLEDPNCSEEVMRYDLATVDTNPDPRPRGMDGWNRLTDKMLHWDDADWFITGVQPIENGESCFLVIRRSSYETP